MTEAEVFAALRAKFPAPEYALLSQVRNGTGFSRKTVRTADALVMGLYPSRGLHLSGIEIKVDRHDWIRELKNPDKAEEIARFCDFWWIAAGSEDVVRDGELPTNWGLLVPGPKGLRAAKAAMILEPKPADRLFLAAILRNLSESSVAKNEIADQLTKRFHDGREAAREERRWQKETHDKLLAEVEAFQLASGIQIAGNWQGGKRIGEAVKVILGLDVRTRERLTELLRQTRRIAETIESVIEATGDLPLVREEPVAAALLAASVK